MVYAHKHWAYVTSQDLKCALRTEYASAYRQVEKSGTLVLFRICEWKLCQKTHQTIPLFRHAEEAVVLSR